MFKFKSILVAGALFLVSGAVSAQSAKKLCDAAEKFEKALNYTAAIENYSKAIEVDPKYDRAYTSRAACYEKNGNREKAIEDYKKAMVFSPKDKELYYNAGRLLSATGKYKEADGMLRQAIERDKGYSAAIHEEIKVLTQLRDYAGGVKMTQLAIDDKKSAQNLYAHAVMNDSLKNYSEAEKYYRNARKEDERFTKASAGLALTLIKTGKVDEAMKICEESLKKDPGNTDLLFAKSLASAGKKDYQNAINDITKVILTKPTAQAYMQRAAFYVVMGQHHNAINDYTQVLLIDERDVSALLSRAAAFEHTQNFKAALKDYNKVAVLAGSDTRIDAIVRQARKKIFDLNKETGKPEVQMANADKNIVRVSSDKNELTLKGVIQDASLIKNISVNSGLAKFSPDSLNPEFTLHIREVTKLNELTMTVTDVYNNTSIVRYKLEKTESDKPVIAIETPIATFENEIFIDNNNPDMYLQGRIKDASLIESILVDGISAAFNPQHPNPEFSLQVRIADKSKINIVVKDIYGNENNQSFALNRSGATAAIDNPMGNTWVVFIENSRYLSFPSLEGPAKDVMLMKSALANYKITKTIHKKDMTKTEMEKFFSIELRDYVKNNNINSLMIWYAGHGKYVSPTGYWVPSDGKTDDEFSYFGINNLKAAMQSYSSKLMHTLVITDACESGATFLMAMRGGEGEKRCDNFELTRAKSSQVFTSAGYELASDNSQFTKTFASTLNNNVEPCLPIEKIVKKVSAAVSKAGNQAPKFGKIKDLEDEGGTYFFIKK